VAEWPAQPAPWRPPVWLPLDGCDRSFLRFQAPPCSSSAGEFPNSQSFYKIKKKLVISIFNQYKFKMIATIEIQIYKNGSNQKNNLHANSLNKIFGFASVI
jgi:hypothetical protein